MPCLTPKSRTPEGFETYKFKMTYIYAVLNCIFTNVSLNPRQRSGPDSSLFLWDIRGFESSKSHGKSLTFSIYSSLQ